MLVTVSGMVMPVRPSHFQKAMFPMLVYNGEITSSAGEPKAT